jgi:5-formyltetrahydrofolate cyclo-ligase
MFPQLKSISSASERRGVADHTDAHLLCEYAKSETRSRILSARRSVVPKARVLGDLGLRVALNDLVRQLGTRLLIAGYVPLSDEPGGRELPELLYQASGGGKLILPRLQPDQDLDWSYYQGPQSLVSARRGLREPDGPPLGPNWIAQADLVVVPALATDRTGLRLGRGGGSYDRALVRVLSGTQVVTLLYPQEELEKLPEAPHDCRVTAALQVEEWTITPARVRTVWYDRRSVSLDETPLDPPP